MSLYVIFFRESQVFPRQLADECVAHTAEKKSEDGGEVRDVFGAPNMGILGCTVVRENDKAAAQQQTATHAMA